MWVFVIQNASGQILYVFGFSSLANANAALANFKLCKVRPGWTAQVIAVASQDTTFPVSAAAAPDPKWQFPHSFNFG